LSLERKNVKNWVFLPNFSGNCRIFEISYGIFLSLAENPRVYRKSVKKKSALGKMEFHLQFSGKSETTLRTNSKVSLSWIKTRILVFNFPFVTWISM